jgi:hypothetical protein
MRTLAARSVLGVVIALSLAACTDSGGDRGGGRTDAGGTDSGGGGGTDSGGGGAECEATTCGECTPMGPCGWCESTGTCMVGGSDGPEGGCEDWDYVPSACADFVAPDAGPPRDCTMYTDCDSCTAEYPCGWCVTASGASCMNGTGEGPDTGTCTGWAWLGSECAMPPPPGP